MRRAALALIVIGFLFIVGQGIVTFLVPLVTPVFPNTSPDNVGRALGIGAILIGIFLIFVGIILFFIYRKERRV